MPSPHAHLSLAGICLLAAVGFTGEAIGQVPDSSHSTQGMLVGRVTDTTGLALADAEVLVARSGDSVVIRSGATDQFGDVVLRGLPTGDTYTIRVRKIGYLPARQSAVSFRGSDTLVFEVKLRPSTQLLPDIVARDSTLPVAAVVSDGLIFKPFPFFKCFAIGVEFPLFSKVLSLFGVRQRRGSAAEIGRTGFDPKTGLLKSNSPYDCSQQANNRSWARRVQRATRHVEQATAAGRSPDSTDAADIRQTMRTCGGESAGGALLFCREVFKRTPRDRLARALSAIDAGVQTPKVTRQEKENAELAARTVQRVARHMEQDHRAGRPVDPSDALVVRNVAQACLGGTPADNQLVSCRAILKRTPRATLERLVQMLTAAEVIERHDTAQRTPDEQSAPAR